MFDTDDRANHAPRVDTARLSPREREVLGLLAQGHTAKSIAAQTGWSLASVNERLRQARRKTGIGSSRELARLLSPAENRDEKIDLAFEMPNRRGRFRPIQVKGVIVMAVLIVVAAVVALMSPAQQQAAPADPLVDKLFPAVGDEPRRLAELVRTEQRDTDWADVAEAALRARYAPLVAEKRIRVVRIACAATACEIVGEGLEVGPARIDATLGTLQDAKKNRLPGSAHARWVSISFGKDLFAAYWVREG